GTLKHRDMRRSGHNPCYRLPPSMPPVLDLLAHWFMGRAPPGPAPTSRTLGRGSVSPGRLIRMRKPLFGVATASITLPSHTLILEVTLAAARPPIRTSRIPTTLRPFRPWMQVSLPTHHRATPRIQR